jgi:transketolase
MTQLALQASDRLKKESLICGVLHMHTVKPLDQAALSNWLPKTKCVVTVEEHTRIGGLGSAILEFCNDEMPKQAAKITRIGTPDRFADRYGSQNALLDHWGITVDKLCDVMRNEIARK